MRDSLQGEGTLSLYQGARDTHHRALRCALFPKLSLSLIIQKLSLENSQDYSARLPSRRTVDTLEAPIFEPTVTQKNERNTLHQTKCFGR